MSTKAKAVKLNNVNDVKNWLRSFPVVKKDIENQMSFYEELAECFMRDINWKKDVELYRNEVKKLKSKLNLLLKDYERVARVLDEKEKLVLDVKYLKGVRWDYIERYVFYSRRQAIRIHDTAIKKLVGQVVEA